jgi:hypothetical protein
MASLLDPQTGGVRVKSELGICRVKKSCKLIRLASVSLLMSTWKGMASSMVTVLVKGRSSNIGVDSGWLVSMITGGAGCSSRTCSKLESSYAQASSSR